MNEERHLRKCKMIETNTIIENRKRIEIKIKEIIELI